MTVEIRALQPKDHRQHFHSGDGALDLYFHRYAGQNQFRHHIGVTYVAIEEDLIVGFATVSPCSMEARDLPSGHAMPPYPLPTLRIARLAVHSAVQGKGLGRALLRFCLELAERMRVELGCVGVLVDSKPGAEGFYSQYGFTRVSVEEGSSHRIPPPTLMYLPLGAIPRAR